MPGPNKEMARVARNLIRENEDVRLTVKELEGRGVLGRKAELEIGRAFLGCLWEARHGMPDRWPAVLRGLRAGNLALNYSPMSYTAERPSVPYRGVGSGTDAHMRGGGRKPLPETPVRHAHTALVCQVHDPARGINPLAARLSGNRAFASTATPASAGGPGPRTARPRTRR